jgi:hypothetical protein
MDREPALYVGEGQVEIVITDRPENLGITLGLITNKGAYIECGGPFIWAFNHLHWPPRPKSAATQRSPRSLLRHLPQSRKTDSVRII